jgi:lycopene beta-cyclase
MHYDFVIVGGGVSGLCLAHYLVHHVEGTILIVDRDADPDYNISFWSKEDVPFQPIMQKSWRRIALRYGDEMQVCPLNSYHLSSFWRADFDAFVRRELDSAPNVAFLDANVTEIRDVERDIENGAELVADDGIIRAQWVFDSRQNIHAMKQNESDLLLMQGLAIEIETDRPSFDPETATLFDFLFETPDFDFVYVLPYSPTYALVNCAFVTPYTTHVNRDMCERVLHDYITNRLCIDSYRTVKQCYGRIPLATKPQPRKAHSHIVPIGVRGGMVKSTTSYAFTRIVDDSQRIAESLRDHGTPYYKDDTAWYYRWADRQMVKIFRKMPDIAQEMMYRMFTPETGDSTLSFLDEKNTLAENQELFNGMPRPLLTRFLLGMLR